MAKATDKSTDKAPEREISGDGAKITVLGLAGPVGTQSTT